MNNEVQPTSNTAVRHRHVGVAGLDAFYREAGPKDAPVLLLPHGYPGSSYSTFLTGLSTPWVCSDMRSGCTTMVRSSDSGWRCRRPSAGPT